MSILELVVNSRAGKRTLPDCCNEETFAAVRAFHRTLPGYAPTPLVPLPALAQTLGVKGIYLKDESKRFGLNAFKALGASYAIHKLFGDHPQGRPLTVTATDGNHGKGMAWSTHLLGATQWCSCPPGRWTAGWRPSGPSGTPRSRSPVRTTTAPWPSPPPTPGPMGATWSRTPPSRASRRPHGTSSWATAPWPPRPWSRWRPWGPGAHPHLPPVRRGLYGRGCGRLSGENL